MIPAATFSHTDAIMDMQQNVDGISPNQSDFFIGSVETEPYSDPNVYMDAANVSPSQSSDTPYQNSHPFFQDYIASDVYPSPEIEAESPMSEIYQQHLVEHEQVMSIPRVKEEPGQPLAGSMVRATPSTACASEKATTPAAKPPAKRKRENRYKNAPQSVLIRRRAQNRASQRAYRERKDQRIKDLEQLLEESQFKSNQLSMLLQTSHAELSVASTMSTATSASSAPTPITATSVVAGFDPAAASTMTVAAHPDDIDSMYIYAQMGSSYDI
ncbi:bzip transcription factor [Grosmannia clavigera kw1407]|uniref:Putative transcription factor kapC n=1 Tax=Grosmannia clavigera (strain kw1407 / UAMH 11150) TaxID=655863 RepID=F0XC08_GROCL|nr:bzip transcription factor [Grosmannia clavigera kw1407]EFX03698.1 bzip transcription factor [Grosmannia clavigera kw1407]